MGKRENIIGRVRKYGLRVTCAACGFDDRHYPSDGRIREARCSKCGARALRSSAWAAREENAGRWAQLVHEQRTIRAPFIAR